MLPFNIILNSLKDWLAKEWERERRGREKNILIQTQIHQDYKRLSYDLHERFEFLIFTFIIDTTYIETIIYYFK